MYYLQKKGTHESYDEVKYVLKKFYDKDHYNKVHVYLMQEFVMKNPKRYSFVGVFSKEHRKRIFTGCEIFIAYELFDSNVIIRLLRHHIVQIISNKSYRISSGFLTISCGLIGSLFCYTLMIKIGRRKTILITYLFQIIVFYIILWQFYYPGSQFAHYINFFGAPILMFIFCAGLGGGYVLF